MRERPVYLYVAKWSAFNVAVRYEETSDWRLKLFVRIRAVFIKK
jgi:hypothetical protein